MHALSSLAILTLAGNAACWGGLGHRTVGYLAQQFFTDEAAQLIKDLIKPSDSFDISDAAVWADGVRYRMHWTEGWHFIDAKDSPPENCNLDFARDCKETQGCVISAISNQVSCCKTALILDQDTTFQTRNQALKFLLHFIGDLHQPLHIEDIARGGNDIPVAFDGHRTQRTNLHSVWDSHIPHKIRGLNFNAHATEEKPAASEWAEELANRVRNANLMPQHAVAECTNLADPNECGIEWATETNQLVCTYVFAPGLEWVKENDLGGEYYEGAVSTVELQLARAGVRLAAWINAIAAVTAEQTAFREELR